MQARRPLHRLLSDLYARRKRDDFDFALTRDLIFACFATRAFGIPTVYDAHHPPVNRVAERIIGSFSRSKSLLGMSFNSQGLRKIYSRLGIAGRDPVVAPNGFELEAFEGECDISSLRARLGLPLDRKIVCYCGNTYRGRGIEILVRAAAEIPEVEFLIVGGRERENALWGEMARQSGAAKEFPENIRIRGEPSVIIAFGHFARLFPCGLSGFGCEQEHWNKEKPDEYSFHFPPPPESLVPLKRRANSSLRDSKATIYLSPAQFSFITTFPSL